MKSTPIPEALLAALTYDPESGELHWHEPPTKSRRRGTLAGCRNKAGYIVVSFRGRQYGAHRIAWRKMTGVDAPNLIDHENGDRSDNRWRNIRTATPHQNAANRSRVSTRRNGLPKGVYATPSKASPYRAFITVDGKGLHLGVFPDISLAAAAYARAAKAHFGAYHNIGGAN